MNDRRGQRPDEALEYAAQHLESLARVYENQRPVDVAEFLRINAAHLRWQIKDRRREAREGNARLTIPRVD